jgi:hypothetical protein
MPDDTGIEVVVEDVGDDLTEQERCALHDALSKSWASAIAGHRRPATEILDELRQRRSP